MDKKYEKIDIPLGCNIDDAVNFLLRDRHCGRFTCCDFNGTTLFSDTVNLNKAYKDITGMSVWRFRARQIIWRIKYRLGNYIHKNIKIYWLIKKYEKLGSKILDAKYIEYWNKIVPIRLKDLYHGFELDCCLDIIESLNKNDFEDAKKKISNQGHSGMSYSLVCSMLRALSDNGERFVKEIK